MHEHSRLYIDGNWSKPSVRASLDVVNPATEKPIGRVPAASANDVDAAVRAAQRAFPVWALTPPAERASALARLLQALSTRSDELATLIASEVGTPLKIAGRIQVGLPLTVLESYISLLGEFRFEEEVGNSLVTLEPVGVTACITPWNYPLHQTMAKIAAALAAGCTVVHKPASQAPLSAFVLAEAVDAAGFPPGVYNLVSGAGNVAGAALVTHSGVDMVSFTGSTDAGRRIAELAAGSIKRVALELGGKSASLLLDDADLARAVRSSVNNCFLNSGQTCNALTRLIVPRSLQQEVVTLAREVAEGFVVGDPLDASTRLGPLISDGQRADVRRYIEVGIEEGATLVTGGSGPPAGLGVGFYVRPTVFADVRSEMTIAQEEIFGPVLSILPYEGENDAVRIANDSIYGLAGAVWSADRDRAVQAARRIRTGQIDINGAAFNPLAPFGGFRQSGHGRELGAHGLREFLEPKSVQF